MNITSCKPLVIYLVLTVIWVSHALLLEDGNDASVTSTPVTFSRVLYTCIISMLIYTLCINEYNNLAWAILLLPITISLLSLIIVS